MFATAERPQKQYAIWKPLPGSQTLFLSCPVREVCFAGTRGPGKGLPLTETVYTINGPRPIGELKVGDYVSCPDGSISPVTGVFPQGKRRIFSITFADGSVARCDDQHIWRVHVGGNMPAGVFKNLQMLEVLERFNSGWQRINVPTLDRLEMPMAENYVPMDPYLLGLMLGDGTFAQRMGYCTADAELANYVLANGIYEVSPDSRSGLRCFIPTQKIRDQVAELGLNETRSHTKFVPTVYLNNSVEIRLAVLQGLMDTDGTIDKNGYVTFCSVSEQLAKDVQYLARSLGAKATLTSRSSGKVGTTGIPHQKAYSVYIQTAGKFSPFRLQRKVNRVKPYMHKHLTNKMCKIEEQDAEETVCIKIAHPDGLFVTNDFIVTHNTDAMLMSFAQYCGRGYGDYFRGVIFRRNYKHLDDIIAKSKRWFNRSAMQPKFLAGSSSLKWVWPTGEELLLRAFENEEDYWSYHGHEYPFIGWEELTSWPSINCYESMKSCNRSSFQPTARLPHLPRMIRSSTNPYGVGHAWVKEYFIDPAPYGKIITDKEGNQRVALFGSVKENPYLGEEYLKTLESITDVNKRKAWLEGSWDITSGGMFDDLWDSTKHVLKPFEIPYTWRITRSFDWGSARPFSVGWWAVSDGTEATLADGRKICFPRKTIFRIGEWYGCTGKANEGVHMTARNVAIGINIREQQMKIHNRVQPGPADSAIYAVTDEASIAQNMESEHVFWTPADKRPGSRQNGWELIRDRLDAVAKGEDKPGFYVFDTCRDFLRTVPNIARDTRNPDDVDTDAEDHIADDCRYMVLSADHTSHRVRISGA